MQNINNNYQNQLCTIVPYYGKETIDGKEYYALNDLRNKFTPPDPCIVNPDTCKKDQHYFDVWQKEWANYIKNNCQWAFGVEAMQINIKSRLAVFLGENPIDATDGNAWKNVFGVSFTNASQLETILLNMISASIEYENNLLSPTQLQYQAEFNDQIQLVKGDVDTRELIVSFLISFPYLKTNYTVLLGLSVNKFINTGKDIFKILFREYYDK